MPDPDRFGAADRLDGLIGGFRVSQLVGAAANLGICDLVAREPLTAREIAAASGCAQEPLRRLLLALVAIGILSIDSQDRFTNTEMGELLCDGHPLAMKSVAISRLSEPNWLAWAELARAVRSDAVAYELANSSGFWSDLARDPGLARTFNSFMGSRTVRYAESLSECFDLGSVAEYVDVGGGQGTLLARVLQANPEAVGVLFDQPSGLQGATAYLEAQRVLERVRIESGDFFTQVPRTDGCLFLRRVLHDWPDEDASTILVRCREAMSDGARLFVTELLLPEQVTGTPDDAAKCVMDMHMFVLFGAKERTESEYRTLFDGAGLTLERVLPTSPESTLIARPA
jgi:hypothetical protein